MYTFSYTEYLLCFLKNLSLGQNRILYCFQNSTTIRHGVLFSGYVEFIPTAESSNRIKKKKKNPKQNPSKNWNMYDEGFILLFKFPAVMKFADIRTGQL